ncbi:MAG: glycosyltransferase family 39 protein [Patescibacteria group bacterium]|nr:glycosyltransferase family 39 protein [Patescibacteria group bacterium]
MNPKTKIIAGLVMIMAMAVFFRFYGLDQFPPGLYPDEAVNATDGLRALENHNLNWYYPNNNGREGLFINMLALAFKVLGAKVWVFRAVPALIGSLTVFFIFLLAKEMFGAGFGLLACFFTAASYWHVNFSRIGFRAIFVPLILCSCFYFLFWAYNQLVKNKKKALLGFLLAGLIFGIGFHTYIAFRIAPAVVLVFFALAVWTAWSGKDNSNQKRPGLILKPFLLFGLGALITLLPILIVFGTNPEYLGSRQNDNSISVFDAKNNQGQLILTIGKMLALTLGQFILWGDNNWRHNLPGSAQLSPFEAVMFWLGFVVVTGGFVIGVINSWKLKRNGRLDKFKYFLGKKNITDDPDAMVLKFGVLLAWFFIMLAPAFLTVEGIPHALRSIGSLPAVYLILSVPVYFLLSQACRLKSEKSGRGKIFCPFVKVVVIIGILTTASYNAYNYFVIWGESPQAAQAFEKRLVNIGEYLNQSAGKEKKIYVVANIDSKKIDTGFPVSLETIRFINWEKRKEQDLVYILPEDTEQIEKANNEIILEKQDQELENRLKRETGLERQTINLTPEYGEETGFTILRSWDIGLK